MWKSIGTYVTVVTAGTPVKLTSSDANPPANGRRICHTVMVQAHESNTGMIYILDRLAANKTTGLGVLAKIAAPTLSSGVPIILPAITCTIPYATGAIDANTFYLDATVSGDKALVSIVVA